MRFRIAAYLFQLAIYSTILWFGCLTANIDLPSPLAAPWLWALVALTPVLPGQWSGWASGTWSFGGGNPSDE